MLIDTIMRGPKVQIYNGQFFFLDTYRDRWLSTHRHTFSFGLDNKNISSDRYMTAIGRMYTNNNGYNLIRNSVITGLSVRTDGISDCEFHIRRNGVGTDVTSISLSGVDHNEIEMLNIDLDKGDFLQIFMEVKSGNVDYPLLSVEVCWRHDS